MIAGWPTTRFNNYAYDWMLTREPADQWTPQSVVVAIDEQTLSEGGGMRAERTILAAALVKIAAAGPKAVALDVILHDETKDDDSIDPNLAAALAEVRNLVLPCELITVNHALKWEDPLPLFRESHPELGHVYRGESGADGVNRELPLEAVADGERRWALALKAFAVAHDEPIPIDSPDDVQIGAVTIPAPRRDSARAMPIRYLPPGVIPRISVAELDQNINVLRGKTVFLGITALTAAMDRVWTPYQQQVSGVEIHAQAYETIARGRFLTPVSNLVVPLVCALFAVGAGLIFALRSGWQAYALGAVLLGLAHWMPLEFFHHSLVFPYFAPVAVAWFSTAGAASFQYFFVRRQLRRSESEKSRYQQAIHWAAHEMRTPLTAIQGSSEIMTRYTLTDVKRQQLGEMINSESKRLARMIQTFLDVERLADGQMEMKRELFQMGAVVETCVKRVAPIADRKNISLSIDGGVEGAVTGDRELMEYAVYNLLTNAVKYSPAGTEIHVGGDRRGAELRLWVRDQGIGMDAKELKNIFKKFYRTRRAEASGEVGTGIGLSIVEQIITHHGGRMEVTSEPGKGSCFTMVMAGSISGAGSQNAETLDRRG
jgi:signal transduction histidine kinase